MTKLLVLLLLKVKINITGMLLDFLSRSTKLM